MFKRLMLPLMLIVILFGLSGCYKMNGELTVDGATDTVSGSVLITVPDSVYSQAKVKGQFVTSNLPEGMTAEPYALNGLSGYNYVLASVPIAALNGKQLPLKFSKKGENIVVTGDFRRWFPTAAQLKKQKIKLNGESSAVSISLRLTMPGAIVAAPSTLQLDGNVVTLSGKWLKANRQFKIEAKKDAAGVPVPTFNDFPSAEPDRNGQYPLPVEQRNELPVILFSLMIGGGLITFILGHYGNVSRIGAKPGTKDKKQKKSKK